MNEKWMHVIELYHLMLNVFAFFSAHAEWCIANWYLCWFHICSVVFVHKLLNSNSDIDCWHWCRLSFIQSNVFTNSLRATLIIEKKDRRLFILFCFLLPLTQSRQHSYYDDALYSLFSVTMLFHFCHVALVLLFIGLNKGFFSDKI